MSKTIIALVFLTTLGTTAQAASAASAKAVVGATAGQKYWLSDGLNRLVFWKPPQAARISNASH